MPYFLKHLFLLSFMFIVSTCNTDDFKPAMVEFDQAFIPVFYYSYLGDLESAQKAMLVLDSKWNKLSIEFDKHAMSYHNGLESFQMVDAWLEDAHCAIENRDSLRALIQLDHARYEMMDFRWREGMTYYLDKVWELEATIDIVVQTVNDPMLSLLEWPEFHLMCYDVENAFNELKQTPMEKDFFSFTPVDKRLLMDRFYALEVSIKDFIALTEQPDDCTIVEAAKEMETAYLEYLFLFGDFESAKSYFALN